MRRAPQRNSQAGLTLIEVLVALALFSLVGLAGFSMLDTILRVQSGTEGRLERLAAIDRALVLFVRDVQESDPAAVKQDKDTLALLRVGTGPVSYQMRSGLFIRSLPRSGFEQTLIDDVQAMQVRSLASNGIWHNAWPLDEAQVIGLPPTLIAVEMTLDLREGRITRLVETSAEVTP